MKRIRETSMRAKCNCNNYLQEKKMVTCCNSRSWGVPPMPRQKLSTTTSNSYIAPFCSILPPNFQVNQYGWLTKIEVWSKGHTTQESSHVNPTTVDSQVWSTVPTQWIELDVSSMRWGQWGKLSSRVASSLQSESEVDLIVLLTKSQSWDKRPLASKR